MLAGLLACFGDMAQFLAGQAVGYAVRPSGRGVASPGRACVAEAFQAPPTDVKPGQGGNVPVTEKLEFDTKRDMLCCTPRHGFSWSSQLAGIVYFMFDQTKGFLLCARRQRA